MAFQLAHRRVAFAPRLFWSLLIVLTVGYRIMIAVRSYPMILLLLAGRGATTVAAARPGSGYRAAARTMR